MASSRHMAHDPHRQRMIDETSAWLTWALNTGADLPRIPRAAVDQGGYDRLLQLPAARAAVLHWWGRTLDLVAAMQSRG